jgi:hypothetical protein
MSSHFFIQFLFQLAPKALNNIQKILAAIAHNVPAVYDVFAVAIKETVGFQQPQKCAGEKTHKGRSPTAFFRRPSPLLRAQHIQSCYTTFGRTPFFFKLLNP